jgi:hypothetical protein
VSALTLDDISKARLPLKVHSVAVPEFGSNGDGKPKEAFIAELSADERDSRIELAWNQYKRETAKQDNGGATAWMAAACLCDDSRNFLCPDPMTIARTAIELGKLGKVTVRLSSKALEVNGLGAADIEALEKN